MFYYLFGLGILYWVALSILCYRQLKKIFKKYRNTPRLQVPANYNAFLRTDFGKWDQKALLKGSYTRFPLRITLIVSALAIYAILGTIYGFCKLPPIALIKLFRRLYGRTTMKILLNVKEQFDAGQKITTPIIIANHSTGLDILYIGFCHESIASFVAKKEIQKMPLIRQCARFLQTILLDRSSPQARAKVKIDIEERVKAFEEDNQDVFPLLIFPEGTVSNGRSLMEFKNGAFQTLSPITIFSLRYESKQFNMGDNQLAALEYYLLSLCTNCDLIVKKKIVQPLKSETIEVYRERCRTQLADMGDFKMYDCSFKEYQQYERLFKNKLAELKSQKAQGQSA